MEAMLAYRLTRLCLTTLAVALRSAARSEFDEAAKARIESHEAGSNATASCSCSQRKRDVDGHRPRFILLKALRHGAQR